MKRLNRLNKKRLLLIAVPVLLLVIYYSYNQFDAWRTSQKFANLEQDIDTLKSELEKQGIQEISKNKYCLRDGEKFGGGQLRCSVTVSSTTQTSFKDAESLLKKIEEALVASNFQSNGEVDKQDKIVFVPYAYNKFYCRLLLTGENINNTQLEFYCIDAVNHPVYPINE